MLLRRWATLAATIPLLAGCGGGGPLEGLGLSPAPPLDIAAPISGRTHDSLLGSTSDLGQCRGLLAQADIAFTPVADRADSDVCRIEKAGILGADMGVRSRMNPQRPMMTCRLAAALAVWRRQSVEPAAREILGAEVAQIDHMGVYACRNVNNQTTGRPSAHARAAAIDIAGIRLTDGRRLTVAKDWNGQGAEARFLRRIRDDACRVFGVTLSPDYNALHHDHLHLEANGGRLCS